MEKIDVFGKLRKETHGTKKKILKLLIDNEEITDTKDILKQEHIFYRQLYKKRTHSNNEIDLLDTETNTINEDERYRCEGHLFKKESNEALFSMKNDKKSWFRWFNC